MAEHGAGDTPTAGVALSGVAEAVSLTVLGPLARGEPPTDGFAPLHAWLDRAGPASPLRRMAEGFALSPAELELIALLLAAAVSEPVARAVAEASAANGGVAGGGLPMWLACRAIDKLHPGTFAAALPLVRFGILQEEPSAPRVEARLALSGPVLDRLLGQPVRDPVVAARTVPLPVPGDVPGEPDQLSLALGRSLAARGPLGLPPAVLVPGAGVEDVAAALAALGLTPWRIAAGDVPEDAESRDRLAARWSREAMLETAALVVDTTDAPPSPAGVAAFADRVLGHVLLTGNHVPDGITRGVHVVPAGEDSPSAAARRWAAALGPERAARLGRGLNRVAAQFRLDAKGIATAAARAAAAVDAAPDDARAEAALWHVAARTWTPSPLPGVSLVEPAYDWDDIVLPPATEAALRRVEVHVRHAAQVFDEWGFAARVGGRGSWRGRGVAALFCGPSGTGKTMAAEVLASALDLRVMVIDLSRIISKWVGETSKNVAAVFEAAERSGSMMVWNEGDAVLGNPRRGGQRHRPPRQRRGRRPAAAHRDLLGLHGGDDQPPAGHRPGVPAPLPVRRGVPPAIRGRAPPALALRVPAADAHRTPALGGPGRTPADRWLHPQRRARGRLPRRAGQTSGGSRHGRGRARRGAAQAEPAGPPDPVGGVGVSRQPPIRVRIGTLRVTSASAVEARRLADALPAALERMLRTSAASGAPVASGAPRRTERPEPVGPSRRGTDPARRADRVAAVVAEAVRARIDQADEAGDAQ